jgi:hypothetical protein
MTRPSPRRISQTCRTQRPQKAKESADASLLTLDLLGSPTWTRTRDLRINSQYKWDFMGPYETSWDREKPLQINRLQDFVVSFGPAR